MVTTLSTSCNCRSQTWLLSIFCYRYKLSITILIQFLSFLKMCISFWHPLCAYIYVCVCVCVRAHVCGVCVFVGCMCGCVWCVCVCMCVCGVCVWGVCGVCVCVCVCVYLLGTFEVLTARMHRTENFKTFFFFWRFADRASQYIYLSI